MRSSGSSLGCQPATSLGGQSSLHKLAKEIGYANPRDTNTVRCCIERLWKVSVIAKVAGQRSGFRCYWRTMPVTLPDRWAFVALNPLLTSAIWANGRHVRIDMTEVRHLNGSIARLLHQRLYVPGSIWSETGCAVRHLGCLCFPDEVSMATHRKRQSRVRKALDELAELWAGQSANMPRAVYHRPACTITIMVTNHHEIGHKVHDNGHNRLIQ